MEKQKIKPNSTRDPHYRIELELMAVIALLLILFVLQFAIGWIVPHPISYLQNNSSPRELAQKGPSNNTLYDQSIPNYLQPAQLPICADGMILCANPDESKMGCANANSGCPPGTSQYIQSQPAPAASAPGPAISAPGIGNICYSDTDCNSGLVCSFTNSNSSSPGAGECIVPENANEALGDTCFHNSDCQSDFCDIPPNINPAIGQCEAQNSSSACVNPNYPVECIDSQSGYNPGCTTLNGNCSGFGPNYVPVGSTSSSNGSSDQCAATDSGDCNNTSGCAWDYTASTCKSCTDQEFQGDSDVCSGTNTAGGSNGCMWSNNSCTASLPAPTNLTATAIDSTDVQLNWLDNAGNNAGIIFYSTNGSSFTKGSTTDLGVITFTEQNLSPSTQYCFYVEARILFSTTVSAPSNTACVTTPADNSTSGTNQNNGPTQCSSIQDSATCNNTSGCGWDSLYTQSCVLIDCTQITDSDTCNGIPDCSWDTSSQACQTQ